MRIKLNTKVSAKSAAFSLIELLVVVAIIGVLVTLALPRYKSSVARSRQGEAKSNLGTIRKLQEAHWLYRVSLNSNGTGNYFAGALGGGASTTCTDAIEKNALGFRLTDCEKAYYNYTAVAAAPTAVSSTSRPVYPDCTAGVDTWSINQNSGDLSNTDIVSLCKD